MTMREKVIVTTPAGLLHGHLFVGADALPELYVHDLDPWTQATFRPATFPAVWTVYPIGHSRACNCYHTTGWGVLYDAWQQIGAMRQEIIEAQRDADDEERREPDCLDVAKAYLEAHDER